MSFEKNHQQKYINIKKFIQSKNGEKPYMSVTISNDSDSQL